MISILRAAPAAALAILIAAPVAAQPPQDDAHKREADLIQRATAALKAKDLNAGRDLLSQASELVPEDATPVFGLIELDLHDKRYDEAAQLADRKLKVVRDAQGMELLLRESFKVQILWAADAATPKEDARKRLNRAIALAVTLDTAPIRVSVVLDAISSVTARAMAQLRRFRASSFGVAASAAQSIWTLKLSRNNSSMPCASRTTLSFRSASCAASSYRLSCRSSSMRPNTGVASSGTSSEAWLSRSRPALRSFAFRAAVALWIRSASRLCASSCGG